MEKMIDFNADLKIFQGKVENGIYLPNFENINLKKLLINHSVKNIAAACQKRLEDVVLSFIDAIDDKNFNLSLAGGIFANVKLNQRIANHKNVKNIYIFPNMGDGGLSIGASSLTYLRESKKEYRKFQTCTWEHLILKKKY